MDLELLKQYALSFIGTKYYYGGDDPISGFDCSGLVCELLRASGVMPWNFRDSAKGIYEALRFRGFVCYNYSFGCVVFFGKSKEEISHVGFCIDPVTMIESGGGESSTLTEADAIKRNAFVRLRPIEYRKDFVACIKPAYGGTK